MMIPLIWGRFSKWRDFLLPERQLVGTPWESEWYALQRASTIKLTKIYAPVLAIIWLLHMWFFDPQHNLQPVDWWVKFRLIEAATAIVAGAFCFWPRIAQSRLYILPLATIGFVTSVGQAEAMLRTDIIPLNMPQVFLLFHVLVLRRNIAWSIGYSLIVIAGQWHGYSTKYGHDMTLVYSSYSVLFIGAIFGRAGLLTEVGSFLNSRRLVEAREREAKANEQAAKAKEAMLKKELELSGAVQTLLMPPETSASGELFRLIGCSLPATECGGDWWWHHHHGDKVRVLMADVTGHGAGPAMVTASVSSFTKVLYDPDQPFEDLLNSLRSHYRDYFMRSNYWMTLTGCELDLKTGKVRAWFAGSPPIFCVEENGDVTTLSEVGGPLGSGLSQFGYAEHNLRPGGRVVLTTDGLMESKRKTGGGVIGMRRTLKKFKELRDQDGERLMHEFLAYVEKERADLPQDDDYTFIVVDYKPSQSARSAA